MTQEARERKPKTKPKRDEWLCGDAAALGALQRLYDSPSMVCGVLTGDGLDIQKPRDAGVEKFDLNPSRRRSGEGGRQVKRKAKPQRAWALPPDDGFMSIPVLYNGTMRMAGTWHALAPRYHHGEIQAAAMDAVRALHDAGACVGPPLCPFHDGDGYQPTAGELLDAAPGELLDAAPADGDDRPAAFKVGDAARRARDGYKA